MCDRKCVFEKERRKRGEREICVGTVLERDSEERERQRRERECEERERV